MNRSIKAVAISFALAVSFMSTRAHAAEVGDESPPKSHFLFGQRGSVVLTGATYLGGSTSTYSHSDASVTSFNVNPAFDWFFDENISIGLSAPIAYSAQRAYGADGSVTRYTATSYLFGARLGYNAPLGQRFSIYFLTTFGGGFRSYEEAQVSPAPGAAASSAVNDQSDSGFFISFYLPLLFHVTPHLFAGFGPSLYHDLSRTRGNPEDTRPDNLATTIGLSLVVGGSF